MRCGRPTTGSSCRTCWSRCDETQAHAVPLIDEVSFQRLAAERVLQRDGATLRAVTEAVPDAIMAVDATACLRFVNGAFERWYGKPRTEILGRALNEVVGDDEYMRIRPWVRRALPRQTLRLQRDDHRLGDAAHVAH